MGRAAGASARRMPRSPGSGDRDQCGLADVLQQEYEEFGGPVLAGVAPDRMHVVGSLVEALPWRQGDLLAASHAHHDRAFEHIDESVRVVSMDRIGATGRIFDGEHQYF